MSITAEQRRAVRALANNCYEYCRIAEGGRLASFHIDHIIPLKHGGSDELDNLCLACLHCNSYKGPNVTAIDPLTDEATKLFNPRIQLWDEHFRLGDDTTITGLTPEGRATVIVLRMNDETRIQYRQMGIELREYPCMSL